MTRALVRAASRIFGTPALYLTLSLLLTSCAFHHVSTPVPPTNTSYIDLEPGWRLRVVTPILKSGGYRVKPTSESSSGDTVALSVGDDFLGYEVAFYAVARDGVQLISAETTRNGQTVPQPQPVAHLFQLPAGVRYVRLIYLVRDSQADHDMAVAAADDMQALNALTQGVLANPAGACHAEERAFCAWIPAGIAVVPEIPKRTKGVIEWIPAR